MALLGGGLAPAACEPAYFATIAPDDASFEVSCASSCGQAGRDDAVIIDVTFVGHGRQFAACCGDVPALRAWLETVHAHWCDGLDVPDKKIGDLTVGVTQSKLTKKRGVTLDQGDGYVTFQCGGWFEELIEQLEQAECCAAAPAESPSPPAVPPSG